MDVSKGGVLFLREGNRHPSLASFGFLVLILIFQKGYSSYSSIGMEYQAALGFFSMLAWVMLFALERWSKILLKVYVPAAFVLLVSAFCVQESVLLGSFGASSDEALVVASSALFSVGYALYCRVWLTVFERKLPKNALMSIAGASVASAIVSCLPPLVFGVGLLGNVLAFCLRIVCVAASIWCVHVERARSLEWHEESCQPASVREVCVAIGLVIIAVIAVRFVQGLLYMNETGYLDYGNQALLVVSPMITAVIIVLAWKKGSHSNFVSLFYWGLVMFSLVLLLAVSAATDSSIAFLWVLSFAVYAQIDVAFMGVLASVRRSFGASFGRLVCVLFFFKDAAFVSGRLLNDVLDVSAGSLVCTLVVLFVVVGEIIAYTIQALNAPRGSDEPPSIPEALASSLAAGAGLTLRECDVLVLLLEGRSYTNIATRLFISKSTVKTHANHIYSKLGVGSRDELIDLLGSTFSSAHMCS